MKQTPLQFLKSQQKPGILKILFYILLVSMACQFIMWVLSLLLNMPVLGNLGTFLFFAVAIYYGIRWLGNRSNGAAAALGVIMFVLAG